MPTYKIIGGDQKQYGPVSEDELRQWIAEGRLSDYSLALAEGGTEWKPLTAFPEFAAALNAQAAARPPVAANLLGPADVDTNRPGLRPLGAIALWFGPPRSRSLSPS